MKGNKRKSISSVCQQVQGVGQIEGSPDKESETPEHKGRQSKDMKVQDHDRQGVQGEGQVNGHGFHPVSEGYGGERARCVPSMLSLYTL